MFGNLLQTVPKPLFHYISLSVPICDGNITCTHDRHQRHEPYTVSRFLFPLHTLSSAFKRAIHNATMETTEWVQMWVELRCCLTVMQWITCWIHSGANRVNFQFEVKTDYAFRGQRTNKASTKLCLFRPTLSRGPQATLNPRSSKTLSGTVTIRIQIGLPQGFFN
jgi:hypothetical protein